MRRLSPRRPLNKRVNSSSERKRSENRPKIHCCCSRSSMASGQQTMWRSTETRRASWRRNSWRSQRSTGRSFHMIGHRLMGTSLMLTGDIPKGRAHYNQAFALYDPAKHRPLATRFGQDVGVSIFVYRALAHWMLGYPETALADADHALEDAREGAHAGTLMYAQLHTSFTNILCAKYAAANAQSTEVVRLADEKGGGLWKALGTMEQGCVLALSGKASEAIQVITSGITTYRSTGSRVYLPFFLAHLSKAYAELGQFDQA